MVAGGIVLGSALAPALADEKVQLPLSYVWWLCIKPEKRDQFRKNFSDLSRFNVGLPKGSSFEAVYETLIGKGNEPDFQIWFRVPSLTAFEAEGTQEGIRKFHEEIKEYLDPFCPPWNRFLRQIGR
jgi:hypothetical protein